MNFMQWLNSLDELLFEIVGWLLFYPVTLWCVVRRPQRMMAYAEAQLGLEEDKQYQDTLSPPVFLILSLLLAHAFETRFEGLNPVIASHHGLAGLINDDTSLLLLRAVIYGVFPLVLGFTMVRAEGASLDRGTLKGPFYAQCYVITPFLLMISIGDITLKHVAMVPGAIVLAAAFVFHLAVQTRWFAHRLNRRLMPSFFKALAGTLAAMLAALAIAVIFVL